MKPEIVVLRDELVATLRELSLDMQALQFSLPGAYVLSETLKRRADKLDDIYLEGE